MDSAPGLNLPAHAPGYSEALPPYRDDIPEYSASLQFYGLALHKIEFDTPWSDRSSALKPVVVELNSNQLNLYEFVGEKNVVNAVKSLFKYQNYDDGSDKATAHVADISDDYFFDGDAYGDDIQADANRAMFKRLRQRLDKKKTRKRLTARLPDDVSRNKMLFEPTSDPHIYKQFAAKFRGSLLHSYTLLNLNVGEAPSTLLAYYKEEKPHHANTFTLVKYRNTLRLRVEYTQMLLHLWSFHGKVHWFRNMSVGRDLTSSIDERKLSALKSIPRHYSAANNALLESAAREALVFNPETRKMHHRNSFLSVEDCTSCFSECSMNSARTRASSVTSSCSEVCKRPVVDVYGSKIFCLENYYTPIEKQYISNCIPVLNSFDKWTGQKLTISDYESLVPKRGKWGTNDDGNLFISQYTFNNSVRNFNKQAPNVGAGVRRCKDFYVENAGLVSLDGNVS